MTTLRGMIATVGGSPEPIVKTLEEHRPGEVLFVTSPDTRDSVYNDILPGIPDDYDPKYEVSETNDPFDFEICYQQIKETTFDWLRRRQIHGGEVYSDITGGTKVMAAALALVAVEYEFKALTYVAGTDRDENGRVKSGTEYIVQAMNPWHTYAVRDLDRANRLLSDFHAQPASDILSVAAQKCGDELKARLETYTGIANCLARADRFDFGKGKSYLSGDLHHYLNRLKLFDYTLYENMRIFADHWQAIRDQTKDSKNTPGRETLIELLANAERRAHRSRFDDAVARLYRAVELHGQILLKQAFGAELGRPTLEDFPEPIRKDVKKILGDPPGNDGRYEVPLQKTFCLLKLSDNDAISRQSKIGEALVNHLSIRNNSILAHGARPVDKSDYEEFWDKALTALRIKDSDIPRWPKINFTLS